MSSGRGLRCRGTCSTVESSRRMSPGCAQLAKTSSTVVVVRVVVGGNDEPPHAARPSAPSAARTAAALIACTRPMLGSRAVPSQVFVDALAEQIGEEFAASQQYVAIAVHYDGETLPRLAAFFYRQAVEERNHAMMMLRYLIDSGAPVRIPALPEPQCDFDDLAAPVRLALEQEREVAGQISELARVARDAGDYPSERFTQWFLKEQ